MDGIPNASNLPTHLLCNKDPPPHLTPHQLMIFDARLSIFEEDPEKLHSGVFQLYFVLQPFTSALRMALSLRVTF